MPPEEKTLSLSFEVTMSDVRGGLNLALPASVSNALLRKISADWAHHRRPGTGSRERLMRLLLDCPFQVELDASDVRVPVRELSELAPGRLLPFRRSASEPASLAVSGVEMFRAVPARCGAARAARTLERTLDRTLDHTQEPAERASGNVSDGISGNVSGNKEPAP
jgi:flagellar motor switch protein FliM